MDPQLSSNANSALVAVLDKLPQAQFNPFEYSVSKFIPPHANQTQRILPESQGQCVPGGTSVFQLPKIGLLTDSVIEFELEWDSIDADTVDAAGVGLVLAGLPVLQGGGRGFLDMIERITFENSNREIFTLSADAILALYSDLSLENRMSFCKAVGAVSDPFGAPFYPGQPGRAAGGSNSTDGRQKFACPLLMCITADPALMSMLSFLEPCQVKIKWANKWNNFGACYLGSNVAAGADSGAYTAAALLPPTVAATDTQPGRCVFMNGLSINQASLRLNCNFAQLPQQITSKLVEDNFGSGSLSQLTWDMEQLPPVTVALPKLGEVLAAISIPIQTAKCVSDIYVMMYIPRDNMRDLNEGTAEELLSNGRGILGGSNAPLPLESLALYGSGQVLMDTTPAQTLAAYSRRTMSGENGGWYATSTHQGGWQNRFAESVIYHTNGATADISAFLRTSTVNKSTGHTNQAGYTDALNSCFIYKIPIAKLSSNKNFLANTLSARELANFHVDVKIPTWFSPDGGQEAIRGSGNIPNSTYGGDWYSTDTVPRNAVISVVLRTQGITQTDSQSGRVTSVLSN